MSFCLLSEVALDFMWPHTEVLCIASSISLIRKPVLREAENSHWCSKEMGWPSELFRTKLRISLIALDHTQDSSGDSSETAQYALWKHKIYSKPWHLTSVLKDPGPSGHLGQRPPTLFSPPSPAALSWSWELAPPTQISNPGLAWNTHSLHQSGWLLRAGVNFTPVGRRFCSICLGVFTLGLPLGQHYMM